MFKTRMRSRTAAVFAAVAGLLLTTAATAAADDPPSFPDVFPDHGRTGTLTITKLADPSGALAGGDGSEVELPPDATGLPGVHFRVQIVDGVNLTTRNGWETASSMTVDEAKASVRENPTVDRTMPTGPDGIVSFDELPLGLYLVTEVPDPSTGEFPTDIIPTAEPFLVTIPMTDPVERDHWMYDVHVYPKNADTSTTKTVNDANAALLGDYVEFDVTMTVPRGATSLKLTDKLDERLQLTMQNGDFFWITGSNASGPVMDSYSDGLAWGHGDAVLDQNGRDLTVTFSAEFLAEHEGDTVGFRIRAQVVGILDADGEPTLGNGEITNQAHYFVSTPGGDAEGDSNEVVTKWGEIVVHKFNQDRDVLSGAEFCLARTLEDAREGICAFDGGATNEHGIVVFPVRYSDFANGADITRPNDAWQTYWLFEKKAPEGYELQTQPIQVTVRGTQGGVAHVTVTNYPHNAGFPLPEIGGNRAILPIIAAVIAAGGAVWLIRSRRQEQRA